MHPQQRSSLNAYPSKRQRSAWATTLLTAAIALSLSGCASYWQSNHRSWRNDDAEATSTQSQSLHGASSAQTQQYNSSSPFAPAGSAQTEFGRHMGVREYETDWEFTERPAVPDGFSTHQRVQRVSFAVGASNLDQEARGALMQVRDQLEANTRWQVLVVGMTDKEREQSMQAGGLSGARAQNVKKWLAQQGIDPDRISTMALGSRYAVGDQFQPMTMRSDRRVEVWAFM